MARKTKMSAADLIAAAAKMGGAAGREVIATTTPCPHCKDEGKHTVSGGTIMLRKVDGVPTCMGTHGVVTVNA